MSEKIEKHFNKLTPAEAERLALLAEEAGEIVQAVGKILRHGYASFHPQTRIKNHAALATECGQFLAIVDLMIASGDFDQRTLQQAYEHKIPNSARYFHHQKERT